MSKQPPPAPTASAVGPCPTVMQIVGRPGTGSLPSTIAPPDHLQANVIVLLLVLVNLSLIRISDLSDTERVIDSITHKHTIAKMTSNISRLSDDDIDRIALRVRAILLRYLK